MSRLLKKLQSKRLLYIFESSSSTVENHEGFFSRFFSLFGGVSDDKMCPVNGAEYPSTYSSFMDNLCNMLVRSFYWLKEVV